MRIFKNPNVVIGGGAEPTTPELYTVRVVDYDGTVLKEAQLPTGGTFSLPNVPTHSNLVFEEWVSAFPISEGNLVTVTDSDIIIGAVYHTLSGKSELDVEVTPVTGLTIELADELDTGFIVEWGDGTTFTGEGEGQGVAHTYADYGKYVVKITHPANDPYLYDIVFGNTSNNLNGWLKAVRLAEGIDTVDSMPYCSALKYFMLTKSVTDIPASMFAFDYSLDTVILPSTITQIPATAFQNCYSLKNVAMSQNMTEIMSQAFINCSILQAISLPDSCVNFGQEAFLSSGLLRVSVPPVAVETQRVFSTCTELKLANIRSGATVIGSYMFAACPNLETVNMPDSVTDINTYAFYGDYSLKNVVTGTGLSYIGIRAFQYCTSLESIDCRDATQIRDYTFANCTNLKSVKLSPNLFTFGNYAFQECKALKTIELPANFSSFGSYCFYNSGIESITTPPRQSVTFNNYCFNNCVNLKNVTFTTGYSAGIGQNAFQACTRLEKLGIPSLNYIQTNAFSNCRSITAVRFGSNFTSIASSAFAGLLSCLLYDFTALTQIPTLAATSAFGSINPACKIVVRDSLYNSWKAATNWATYANYIYKQSEVQL